MSLFDTPTGDADDDSTEVRLHEALPFHEVEKRVLSAIDALFRNDEILFANNAHEQTISQKFSEKLKDHFTDWDVNVEYNRDGCTTKRMPPAHHESASSDYRGNPMKPDIIVHRLLSKNNLLAIETKNSTNKSAGAEEYDHEKLSALCGWKFGYEYGLFVRFTTGRDVVSGKILRAEGIWYKRGAKKGCRSRVKLGRERPLSDGALERIIEARATTARGGTPPTAKSS